MQKIKSKIMEMLISNKIITEDDKPVYEYGFEIFISTFALIAVGLIFSIIFKVFVNSLVFILVWLCLRSLIGGVHTQTRMSCYIISVVTLVAGCVLSKYLPIQVGMGMAAFSLIFIYLIAPVVHENRPMSEQYRKKIRKSARIVSLAIVIVMALLYFTPFKSLIAPAGLSMFINCVLMLIGYFIQKYSLKLKF